MNLQKVIFNVRDIVIIVVYDTIFQVKGTLQNFAISLIDPEASHGIPAGMKQSSLNRNLSTKKTRN